MVEPEPAFLTLDEAIAYVIEFGGFIEHVGVAYVVHPADAADIAVTEAGQDAAGSDNNGGSN